MPDPGTVQDRAVAALASALVPHEFGGPRPADLAAAARPLLGAQPADVRAGVTAAGTALALAALARHGRPLHRLQPAERAALLAATQRTGPVGGAVLDGVKALLLLVHGGTTNRPEIDAVARRHAPARADASLTISDATELPARLRADVVVVGSGAGGAFAARELARGGLDVLVLEEGERWTVDRIRATGPIERFAGLYRDGGATVALGLPPVALPIGRAVGGTTVVNSGTCYRPPAAVVRTWHEDHGLTLADPERLAARLDDVWSTLGVAPAPDDVLGANARLALAGAEALGWDAAPLRRNAPGCAGSCQCALGCPRNAKAGVHLTALPQACDAGARIVQRLRVDRVTHEHGRATGLQCRDRDGRRVTVAAPLVVVAAGATETPALLRRSDLGGHPRLGRGLSIHPALGVAGTFDAPVHAWRGVLQSVGIEEHHEREGILIEATATPPGMGSMILPGVGEQLLRGIDGETHVAALGAMVDDAPSGVVVGARRPRIGYRLHRDDARRLVRAAGLMAQALLAAGAREVALGGGAPPVRRAADLPDALTRMHVRRLHLAAFHPTGTAAAGSDRGRHPVDPHGRLRGVDGVLVADASILPRCPGVNPQISIMALAAEVAAGAVARSDATRSRGGISAGVDG